MAGLSGSLRFSLAVIGAYAAVRPCAGHGTRTTSSGTDLDLHTGARRRPFPTWSSRSSSIGWPGIRVGSILCSPRAIPPWPIFPWLDGDLGTLDLGPTSPAGSGNSSAWSELWWQRPKPPRAVCGTDLGRVGFNLFEHLLPGAVQEVELDAPRGVKSLMVLSDDPHIPWELSSPFGPIEPRERSISEDGLLGRVICADALAAGPAAGTAAFGCHGSWE